MMSTVFPEREPGSVAEAKIIEIQTDFDALGRVAWQGVLEGRIPEPRSLVRMHELGVAASGILSSTIGDNATNLVARYFYERTDERSLLPHQIQYPVTHGKYSAHLSGKLTGVRPLLVEHPSPTGVREPGFRLCAQIEAMSQDLRGSQDNTADVWVPVGELYLQDNVKESKLRAEALVLVV